MTAQVLLAYRVRKRAVDRLCTNDLCYIAATADRLIKHMLSPITILERAFQLAGEGGCRNWEEVVTALKRENFIMVDSHFSSALLRSQINKLCKRDLAV